MNFWYDKQTRSLPKSNNFFSLRRLIAVVIRFILFSLIIYLLFLIFGVDTIFSSLAFLLISRRSIRSLWDFGRYLLGFFFFFTCFLWIAGGTECFFSRHSRNFLVSFLADLLGVIFFFICLFLICWLS